MFICSADLAICRSNSFVCLKVKVLSIEGQIKQKTVIKISAEKNSFYSEKVTEDSEIHSFIKITRSLSRCGHTVGKMTNFCKNYIIAIRLVNQLI